MSTLDHKLSTLDFSKLLFTLWYIIRTTKNDFDFMVTMLVGEAYRGEAPLAHLPAFAQGEGARRGGGGAASDGGAGR